MWKRHGRNNKDEIDTEVTTLLVNGAQNFDDMNWDKTIPVGVSKAEHYEGFSEVIEIAKAKIYSATKKLNLNCGLSLGA